MSLTLLTEPTPTSPPSSADDWGYLNTKVTAMVQAFTGRNPVVGSTIKAGTVIPVGNSLYKATVDEAITGSVSLYVKITPSGPTATVSFVSSLTGVSWDHVTGQYIDGSGNVYIFDEARAINDGVLATAYTMQGQIAYIKGGLTVNGTLNVANSVNASNFAGDGDASLIGINAITIEGRTLNSRDIVLTPEGSWNRLSGTSSSVTLPGISSQRFAYFIFVVGGTGSGAVFADVRNGGSSVSLGATQNYLGFAWRIS